MKEITLEQLAPYLPYGLKIIHGLIRKQITAISLESPFVFCTTYLGSRQKQMVNFKEVKPILRPLTDLTKEIEVNGEKFIPIVELAKISFDFEYDKFHLLNDWDGRYGLFGVRFWRGSHEYSFYYNARLQSFKAFTNTNHFELFQKLLSWHFDIYGLIEQGLAIDINTLNK